MSTPLHTYFSQSYLQARERFLDIVAQRGGTTWRYEIGQTAPSGEALTIDVARFGSEKAREVLVISSGTHGVEGFFGSAAQLSFLNERLDQALSQEGVAVVMIHAVNPFGFAHLRRVNEDNVDLNRNFIGQEDSYKGADPTYALLNSLLNPPSPPPRLELFTLRAGREIARHGFHALKSSVAQGQYEFERGLFFGGKGPSRSKEIIAEHLPIWVGEARRVIHLDLHTGLGPWGTYVMAASKNVPQHDLEWLMGHFDQDRVQRLEASKVLYQIRGEFTYFCRGLFPHRDYYPILVEFGTYPIIKVLKAMRTENRATHWCDADSRQRSRARAQLREVFSPASKGWRVTVLQHCLRLFDQALTALGAQR